MNNMHRATDGNIRRLFDTLETDTGDENYKYHFGTKWLVSVAAAMCGHFSPLMLVLVGATQNTGKTEWFRRLLPAELQQYYSESKLDREKDDEILMTQKLIVMDDEMGGKSKMESKRLKELTSKKIFTLREPYGRQNVDLPRLAVLCGTSNDEELLNDPTGNRRILPINILSIDQEMYNTIDKTDLLMEAYHLYIKGYDWHLSKHDIAYLREHTAAFEVTCTEYELFNRYFRHPEKGEHYDTLMTSEIAMKIEAFSGQRMNVRRLGMEMKRMGFVRYRKAVSGQIVWVSDIVQKIVSG
jgi:predicted P-loop ATPase